MPSYKTHSIHIDKCMPYIDKRIDLNNEDLKVFSFGPDTLVLSDYFVFNMQHNNGCKYFFLYLIQTIKNNHELDNNELISFLYGQISHYILDTSFHPYIYYITENIKRNNIINGHLQLELLLDKYIMNKYNINNKNYFKKKKIDNIKTRKIIDELYQKVYNVPLASLKYDIGINLFKTFEENRFNNNLNSLYNTLSANEISYSYDNDLFNNYLNQQRELWLNPITGENHYESIQEIWNNSVMLFIETIEEVNKHLYDDKPLDSEILLSNLSYDTALDSQIKKKFIYTKKY